MELFVNSSADINTLLPDACPLPPCEFVVNVSVLKVEQILLGYVLGCECVRDLVCVLGRTYGCRRAQWHISCSPVSICCLQCSVIDGQQRYLQPISIDSSSLACKNGFPLRMSTEDRVTILSGKGHAVLQPEVDSIVLWLVNKYCYTDVKVSKFRTFRACFARVPPLSQIVIH